MIIYDAVLIQVGLGTIMLAWIEAVYSHPSVLVKANGPILPLSTLQMELAMDAIGSLPQQKVAAYANDLFYINPTITLPNLIKEFEEFSKMSNYKIHMTKSDALDISLPPGRADLLSKSFPFHCTQRATEVPGHIHPKRAIWHIQSKLPPFAQNYSERPR